MLKRLTLINCFTHPRLVVDFTKGFNFITGRNGRGKTLILEMIAYSLFGMRATRGEADDYKRMKVELQISIRGLDYTIQRNGNTDLVYITGSDVPVVQGTAAVNEYLKRTIGYDMEVFNITNYSRQSQTELFTSMMPAARKTMVDKLCGLDQLDVYAKKASDAIKVQNGVVQALASKLLDVPAEPEIYTSLKPREEWVDKAINVRNEKANVSRISMLLTELRAKAPKLDLEASLKLNSLTEATQGYEVQQILGSMEGQKKSIANNAKTDSRKAVLENQIKTWSSSVEQYAKISTELLDQQTELHEQSARYVRRVELSKSLVPHTCPACQHHWSDAHPDYEKFKDAPTPLAAPTLTTAQISGLRQGLADLPKLRDQIAQAEAECAGLSYEVVSGEDFLSILQKFQQIDSIRASMEGYTKAQARINDLVEEIEATRSMDVMNHELSDCEAEIEGYDQYKMAKARFDVLASAYAEANASTEAAQSKIEMLKSVGEAVKTVKQNLKTFLTPSLSKIATRIISEATEGELHTLIVDDNFNITVNSKAVEKLEGSGVSLVNVAMRVALGQVLTNGVMSVFLGDELDKALDHERSANLTTALRRLSGNISQVIVVTHKPVSEDILIHLK